MPIDYSLYLVTDRSILKEKDIFTAVEEALEGGVTLLQLREKDITSRDFYDLAIKMKKLTKSFNVPLIINDRLDIALAVEADGLHIGQEDLPLKIARKLLGPSKILGYSVSNIQQAVYGEQNGADYLGAGSVFPTGSKADAGNPIGLNNLKKIKENVNIPVVGIGGIGITNIREVKSTGIDGVSLISAILGNPNIKEVTGDLLNIWREEWKK